MKMNKQVALEDAARLIKDGQQITIGGTLCKRVHSAFVRDMARQGLRDLELVKPSRGYDIDLLAAAGCVRRIRSGIVSLEQPFGMAPNFRRAVEEGRLEVVENACPTIMASLQAASFGVPFQPVAGLHGSATPKRCRVDKATDPFDSQEVCGIQAVR